MAGPAVSLSGSPTVSPVTAALCFSLPLPVLAAGSPARPRSVFLALSQAPPALAMKTASNCPVTIMPARKPARAMAPRPKPTSIGTSMASRPGPISSF